MPSHSDTAGGTVSPGGRLVAHIQPWREGPAEKDAGGRAGMDGRDS